MVSGSLSTSCQECFSPFPHGTGPLSVSREYLALPDGPGRFAQGSTCPALLRVPLRPAPLRVRSCHALRPPFPRRSARGNGSDDAALQPRRRRNAPGLGYSPFARRYWGNHSYFLFLRVLRCFSSPRWPPATKKRDNAKRRWVVPFGHPRIDGHLHLRADFRSLSRPSSPPRAKASAMRPSFLLFHEAARAACLRATCHRTDGQKARSGE